MHLTGLKGYGLPWDTPGTLCTDGFSRPPRSNGKKQMDPNQEGRKPHAKPPDRQMPNGLRFCYGACGGSRAATKQKMGRGYRLANAPSAAKRWLGVPKPT
jgi:hypothetical protein